MRLVRKATCLSICYLSVTSDAGICQGVGRLRRFILPVVGAKYGDHVVVGADCLVEYPNLPASISQVDVDYIC